MIRRYLAPLRAALMVADGITAAALFLFLVSIRLEFLDGTWTVARLRPLELATLYAVLWVGTLWFVGIYRLRTRWTLLAELIDVARAAVVLLFVSLAILFIFDLTSVSRLLIGMLFLAQPAVTVASRVVLRTLLERIRARGRLRREILIIGAGPGADDFADTVERHRELGLHVIGHLLGPRDPRPATKRPVIGSLDDIADVLATRVVDEVAICLEPSDWAYVEPAARICEEQGKIVRVSLQPVGGVLIGGRFEEVGDVAIVTLLFGPDRMVALAFKRLADVGFSLFFLIVLSPLMLAIGAYVRLREGPPVLFRHERVGLHGRIFNCLKFRTMGADAEERYEEVVHLNEVTGPAFKATNDPRITPSGRFLRRTGLDELPQLVNVLRGEMSLVGPRPAPPREVARYSLWHRRRLMMRPGLTGYWQVEARAEDDFDRRAALDLQYIDRWSLWMDFKIMLRTIPAIVLQQGR